jgi:hypothetical protein
MATTSYMIQFYTEQVSDDLVTTVYSFDDEAYLLLDPNKNTIIREIATEEIGGILGSKFSGGVPIGFTDKAFADVKLVSVRRGSDQYFFAPSHVPSPPTTGVGLAILRVFEIGVSVTSPGQLALGRGIGAHVYIDQSD